MVQHTRKTPDDLRSRGEWNKHDLTMNISKSVIIENHKFGIPICCFISIKLEFLACLSDLFVLASLQSCFFFSAFFAALFRFFSLRSSFNHSRKTKNEWMNVESHVFLLTSFV